MFSNDLVVFFASDVDICLYIGTYVCKVLHFFVVVSIYFQIKVQIQHEYPHSAMKCTTYGSLLMGNRCFFVIVD